MLSLTSTFVRRRAKAKARDSSPSSTTLSAPTGATGLEASAKQLNNSDKSNWKPQSCSHLQPVNSSTSFTRSAAASSKLSKLRAAATHLLLNVSCKLVNHISSSHQQHAASSAPNLNSDTNFTTSRQQPATCSSIVSLASSPLSSATVATSVCASACTSALASTAPSVNASSVISLDSVASATQFDTDTSYPQATCDAIYAQSTATATSSNRSTLYSRNSHTENKDHTNYELLQVDDNNVARYLYSSVTTALLKPTVETTTLIIDSTPTTQQPELANSLCADRERNHRRPIENKQTSNMPSRAGASTTASDARPGGPLRQLTMSIAQKLTLATGRRLHKGQQPQQPQVARNKQSSACSSSSVSVKTSASIASTTSSSNQTTDTQPTALTTTSTSTTAATAAVVATAITNSHRHHGSCCVTSAASRASAARSSLATECEVMFQLDSSSATTATNQTTPASSTGAQQTSASESSPYNASSDGIEHIRHNYLILDYSPRDVLPPPPIECSEKVERLPALTVEEYETSFRRQASDFELMQRVYLGGIDSNELRAALWPLLFKLVEHRDSFERVEVPSDSDQFACDADSSGETLTTKTPPKQPKVDRGCLGTWRRVEHKLNTRKWKEYAESYEHYASQWKSVRPEQEIRFSTFRERKTLIERDVPRSDRQHPFYRTSTMGAEFDIDIEAQSCESSSSISCASFDNESRELKSAICAQVNTETTLRNNGTGTVCSQNSSNGSYTTPNSSYITNNNSQTSLGAPQTAPQASDTKTTENTKANKQTVAANITDSNNLESNSTLR